MGRAAHDGLTVGTPNPQALDAAEQAVLFDPNVALMGQTAYFVIAGFLYFLFKDVVPAPSMSLWSWLAITVFALVVSFDIAFVLRRPSPLEIITVWRKIDKKLTIAFDLIAVGVIFLLFPHGGESHKLVTVAFFVGYVPLQMISDPDNVFGNRFSIVAVLGAFAVVLFFKGDTIEKYLALMMLIYGGVLFAASEILRANVVTVIKAKAQSEHTALALRKALADVSAERDAKTRFIAQASHDLGQPLQAASLFFRQVLAAKTTAQRKSAASGVERAFASAEGLLATMLNHMQLRADQVQPQPLPVDLAALFEQMRGQHFAAAAKQGLQIKAFSTRLKISIDPVLLDRALGNLIVNAITHSQGTRILMVAQRCKKSGFRIWMLDDGIGVSQAEAPRIFEDYFRGERSNLTALPGFGLGLASVRRLAEVMSGSAGYVRRRTGGAAFYLQFSNGIILPDTLK